MRKYYYIYQMVKEKENNHNYVEKFKDKTLSEHSAVQWINDHLNREKYKSNKYIIKPIYSNE